MGAQTGEHLVRARPWPRARRRPRRSARQRRLSAGQAAFLPVRAGARGALSRPFCATRRLRGGVAAQPAIPQRDAGGSSPVEFRALGSEVRDTLRNPHPARSGGRHRHRPAGRAVADRARDRGRDARRVGARRGPAAATDDRRPAGDRGIDRLRRVKPGARVGADRGAGGGGRLRGGGAGDLRPLGRLLTLLNEPPPGWALALPLLGSWLLAVTMAVVGAAWPAWRAAARPPVSLLRGADAPAAGASGHRAALLAFAPGSGALGARLVLARRARLLATATTLGLSVGFVLLLLALASELSTLQTDPSALGERYQLTAALPASAAAVRRSPGSRRRRRATRSRPSTRSRSARRST